MTTFQGDLNDVSSSNTSMFGEFDSTNSKSSANSLFVQSNLDQLTLRQNQLKKLQQQQFLLQQHQHQQRLLQQAHSNGNFNSLLNNSAISTSPVPTQVSSSLAPSFMQAVTPEKPILSNSPPSPADSGVVLDAKSDGSSVSQDLLQSFEQSSKSADEYLPSHPNSSTTNDFISFDEPLSLMKNGHEEQSDFLGLSSNSSLLSESSKISFTCSETDNSNNSTTISPSLAAIWSSPSLPQNTTPSSNNVDDVLFQTLQQQQQQQQMQQQQQQQQNVQQQTHQFSSPAQMSTSVQESIGLNNNNNGLMNPPPGLCNNAFIQNTAAQIQALQQQLAIRRASQTNALTRANSMHPGIRSGAGFLNNSGSKLNNNVSNGKSSMYSSWSNGQQSQSNAWPSSNGRTASSLFNSLHHSHSSGRNMNGTSSMHKQPMTGHPPRLNRSMSTPAKFGAGSYLNYGGGTAATTNLPSLEENPFFRMQDAASQNGLMALAEQSSNGRMSLSSLETQLYDLIRSNENRGLNGHHLQRSQGQGKWSDLSDELFYDESSLNQIASSLNIPQVLGEFSRDRYSRKVFVGGLPPDIDEDEIQASFRQFGPLLVDWPHKAESKSYFPPKGYAFLLFQEEISVQNLISCCIQDGDKLFLRVSSPTIREKPVQIRPWNLSDSDFVLDGSQPLDPRKTIFVGGVPRPLRAVELAMIMDRLYGGVCYAGIDVDPELKYPKGAGRVAFSNQQSYIAAISARFVQLQHSDIDKRVEVKPYVLDDQYCDECQGARSGGKFAPFFCANVTCLQYYCENCWATIHSRPGREFHKPLVKEGADRSSRSILRW